MDKGDFDRFGGWKGIQSTATGFFRAEKVNGRWWLIDPEGNVFLSFGLNHISSCALKYPDTIAIYREKYGSDEAWLKKGVRKDLLYWGFNTIGWTQDVVVRYAPHDPLKRMSRPHPRRKWGKETALFHDRVWEYERYQWAGMPYFHMLNFVNNAYWWDGTPWCSDSIPQYPDVYSQFFEDYCDWVARHYCTQMTDDPYMIGYFYSDTPDWAGEMHSTSWASDLDLQTEQGQERLEAIARRYYHVTHDAIRRYDPNHMLFGDRLLGNRTIPQAVLRALAPTIDVVSIQYGGNFKKEKPTLDRCYELTGKPILLADAVMPPQYFPPPAQERRGQAYRKYVMDALSEAYVVGIHFCGAYIEDRARGWGVKNRWDEPYEGITRAFQEIHPQVYVIASRARPLVAARGGAEKMNRKRRKI